MVSKSEEGNLLRVLELRESSKTCDETATKYVSPMASALTDSMHESIDGNDREEGDGKRSSTPTDRLCDDDGSTKTNDQLEESQSLTRKSRRLKNQDTLPSSDPPELFLKLPLFAFGKCEIRSVIRFLLAKDVPPIEIHRQLCEVYGEECMDIKSVRRWCRDFKMGRTDVHDEHRAGRPSVPERIIAKVEKAMLKDRQITIRGLGDLVPDVGISTIDRILKERLHYHKVGETWVPKKNVRRISSTETEAKRPKNC